jgi:cytochrome P450
MQMPNTNQPGAQAGRLADYPMRRQCPLHPARELAEIQASSERVRRVRLWDGSTPWLVTGYDEVREMLADSRISSDCDRPGFPHNSAGEAAAMRQTSKPFIFMDGQEHKAMRRMLTRQFLVKRMEAMRPKIQALVDGMVDDLLAGPNPVDFVDAFALPLPSLVICDLLGVPYADRDVFQRMSLIMTSRTSTDEEAVAAMEAMYELLDRVVSEKDAEPADDLISVLVVEQLRPGRLSRRDLVSMLQLLLSAGHGTTGNMIALGTLALLQHPEALDEIRATGDPAVIANAVEELLRWLNVVHAGRRRVAAEDLTLFGQRIKAGDGVIGAQEIANRDPAVFENPDRLDFHRKARHHIAFGYGVHQCIGQSLARVELQVVCGTLYRRIPTLALAGDVDALQFRSDTNVYGVEELSVTW